MVGNDFRARKVLSSIICVFRFVLRFYKRFSIIDYPQETTGGRFCQELTRHFLWFVAQCRAESAFKPEAISPAGACGLMQLMPRTWREIRLYLPDLSKDILDPRSNIRAGVWYDRFCFGRFVDITDTRDRLLVAFAAYNCGPTRIRKIIDASGVRTIEDIQPHIPFEETRDYVKRIIRFREELKTS